VAERIVRNSFNRFFTSEKGELLLIHNVNNRPDQCKQTSGSIQYEYAGFTLERAS
jgi:hypothetical protein